MIFALFPGLLRPNNFILMLAALGAASLSSILVTLLVIVASGSAINRWFSSVFYPALYSWLYSDGKSKPSFVSDYSMSAEHEDFAETYTSFLTAPFAFGFFANVEPKFEVIKAIFEPSFPITVSNIQNSLRAEVRVLIEQKALRGPWQQFHYHLDTTGKLINVTPNSLPSKPEERLPGQSTRGNEYAFDLRLAASKGSKDAVTRLVNLQSRICEIIPEVVRVFLPSSESFHIALGGIYPEKN